MNSIVYEINAIFAGLFHKPEQLAGHVALANTSSFFFCIGFGVNVTCTTFIGISAGENKTNSAKKFAYLGILIMILIVVIEEIILFNFRETWAQLFGAEPKL